MLGSNHGLHCRHVDLRIEFHAVDKLTGCCLAALQPPQCRVLELSLLRCGMDAGRGYVITFCDTSFLNGRRILCIQCSFDCHTSDNPIKLPLGRDPCAETLRKVTLRMIMQPVSSGGKRALLAAGDHRAFQLSSSKLSVNHTFHSSSN